MALPVVDTPQIKALPKNRRILVVEDEDEIREMLRMTLEAEGFKVSVLRDGRKIMDASKNCKPDMVISDVMMPGGGGYEVLRSLQGDETTRKIPVLVMSGYAFDHSTKEMMVQEPNVVGFIEKPIRPPSLMVKIHQVLNTKSVDEQMIEDQHQNVREIDFGRFEDRG